MTAIAPKALPKLIYRAFRPELSEKELPPGVGGRVSGLALVYDELDSHGSTFTRGSLERTIRERVAAGKVKLFFDHGDAPITGMYDSHLHIGTVRSLKDVQLADGRWGAYMEADLFTTPEALRAKEYIQGVLATGGETGLSVGCMPQLAQHIKSSIVLMQGEPVERITEFPLSEISITSMQAVPDSGVLAVRTETVAEILDGVVAEAEAEAAHLAERLDQAAAADTADVIDGGTITPVAPIAEPAELEVVQLPDGKVGLRGAPSLLANTRLTMGAAFDALIVALPREDVIARALVAGFRFTAGDAHSEDSNADGPTPLDSDAPAEDSRTTEEHTPVVFASMEERLRALRQSYAEVSHDSRQQEPPGQRPPG